MNWKLEGKNQGEVLERTKGRQDKSLERTQLKVWEGQGEKRGQMRKKNLRGSSNRDTEGPE